MINDKGQVVLTLILVMTVALAIGLSVVQRSLSDISTASKVEQSSRAFSAAEAGIEKKLISGSNDVSFDNGASASILSGGDRIPVVAGSRQQDPLEYPPLSKEEVAQVWLADYTSTANPPPAAYKRNTLDVYWGSSDTDKAALELTLVYYDGSQYQSKKYFYDQISRNNNFTYVSCGSLPRLPSGVTYQCKQTITFPQSTGLMLLRARLLYNNTSQPIAFQPPSTATCGSECSLPPQAVSVVSQGAAGMTRRTVQLFQEYNTVPFFFDYGLFSAGDINK